MGNALDLKSMLSPPLRLFVICCSGRSPTMGERRLELVETCEHGSKFKERHRLEDRPDSEWCSGETRRVLSVPSEEMVEAAAKAMLGLHGRYGQRTTDEAYVRAALTAALRITIEEET
jgi:hypothetical protein